MHQQGRTELLMQTILVSLEIAAALRPAIAAKVPTVLLALSAWYPGLINVAAQRYSATGIRHSPGFATVQAILRVFLELQVSCQLNQTK